MRRDHAPAEPEKPSFREVVTGEKSCWWDGGVTSQTLDAVLHKKQCMPEKNRFPAVIQSGVLRYITPIEGERLQGFPDNHTDVNYRNKPAPDGRRYESIGNSMPVPIMGFVGSRIQLEVENQL
nr:DNA cytosine methyltransferase [Marinobacter nauticus]